MVNPSLDRQFTLTNFKWNLRTQGHLNAEKLGACNYLKLSRIPVDIRLYWNKTNNRETAFSLDELVRGFKIDDRDEAGNAKTLNNIFLWSEGEIPQEPLSDLIELEYNGEGAMITPLLGNKSGAIDKIEKVSVVSTLDRVLNPIKVVSSGKVDGYAVSDFYRFNNNVEKPALKRVLLRFSDNDVTEGDNNLGIELVNSLAGIQQDKTGYILGNLNVNNNCVSHLGGFNAYPGGQINCAAVTEQTNIINSKGEMSFDDKTFIIFKIVEIVGNFASGQHRGNKLLNNIFSNDGVSIATGDVRYSNSFIYNPKALDKKGILNKSIKKFVSIEETTSDFFDNGIKYGVYYNFLQGCNSYILYPTPASPLFLKKIETTTDAGISLFIFKTENTITSITPRQNEKIYTSIIAETNTKKADFNFLLREVSKTSAASEQPYLYMGGLSGIKIPITNGFELAFNNKKSGLDYVVLEIPAGDIYKVELKLLNVYEDETTQS